MKAWTSLAIQIVLFFAFQTSAMATEYRMPAPGNDVVGQNYTITVSRGDSLTTIRKNNDISYGELLEANPHINFYKLKVGQDILIPKQFVLPRFRKGIVINIPELRLYYFTADGKYVQTFPVGLGRKNWRTPLTSATIIRKKEDPTWFVPDSIRNYVYNKSGKMLPDFISPGPKNPLGKYALYLSKRGYLIHGTNSPNSVGTFISSGCMRLLREPIETLYEEVEVGTPVHIIHYPYKAGWLGNRLYLESHKPIPSYARKASSPLNNLDAQEAIYHAIHLRPAKIDWQAVSKNVDEDLGVPEPIGYRFSIRS